MLVKSYNYRMLFKKKKKGVKYIVKYMTFTEKKFIDPFV